MSHGMRLGRWVVPGAGLTLAVAAILFLLVGEAVSEDHGPGQPVRAATTPTASGAPSRRAPIVGALLPPSQQPVAQQPVAQQPRAKRTPTPAPARTRAQADPRRPAVKETPAVLQASSHLVTLAQAQSLDERLRYMERLIADLSASGSTDQAVRVLEGLVDSELPGDLYESETLREFMLARLGDLPGPRVEAALAARLDPERPRPQRLVAIEMLASRGPYAARGELTAIASHDHDVVVQEKARRALQRTR